jgi:serine/threonine protein kinase
MNQTLFCQKYRVREKIAQGGMGIVYRVHDEVLEVERALKVIHPHLSSDSSFAQLFLREARSMAKLGDHPNIVKIYSVEQDQGTQVLVMEFFPGINLSQLIKTRSRLPIQLAMSITQQLASALAYTHSRGIIHRDIKPANVLVDDRGHAKLTDFGIARALNKADVTVTGQVIGTPPYMSPEQARAEALDGRSDLYSLGIVLYEMLSGTHPYPGLPNQVILGKLVAEQSDLSLEFPPDVPVDIQGLIRELLHRKATERIPDAERLLARINSLSPLWLSAARSETEPDATIPSPLFRPMLGSGESPPASEKRPVTPPGETGRSVSVGSRLWRNKRVSLGVKITMTFLGFALILPLAYQQYERFQRESSQVDSRVLPSITAPIENQGKAEQDESLTQARADRAARIAEVEQTIQESLRRIEQKQQQAEAEAAATARAQAEARAKAEAAAAKARAKAEAEAKTKAEAEALRVKAEADRARVEAEKAKAEAERARTEVEQARAKAEAEAREKAEADRARKEAEVARAKAEREAQAKIEAEARSRAEVEARAKAEAVAKELAEAKARAKTDSAARARTEAALAIAQAEKEKAEAEALRVKAEADRARAEAEKAKAEAEAARIRAEAETREKAEADRLKREAEAARLKAEADARAKAETEAKAKAEAEAARAKVEAERVKSEAEAPAQVPAEQVAKLAVVKPDQALLAILERLRTATANRDLKAIQDLSALSGSRLKMLEILFQNYETLEVEISDVIGTTEGATAKLSINRMTTAQGATVVPDKKFRQSILRIPWDTNRWGRVVW